MATLDTRGLFTGQGYTYAQRLHLTELYDEECAAYDVACYNGFTGPAMAAYERAKAKFDRVKARCDDTAAEHDYPWDAENFMGMR